MSRNIFLKKFIKIAYTINLCLSTFDKNLLFEDKEIFKAFEKCGYSLMTSGGEFSWSRLHKNHTLIMIDKFLNIEVQSNKDLRSARKRSYPSSWNPETKNRIDILKTDLQKFWITNKHLLED